MSSEILNATIDGVLNTKLHIQNIPPHITDSHLRSALGNAGQIKDICYFNKNKKQINNNFGNNKKIYNTALITFNTHEEALNVLKNIKNLIDTSSEERTIEAKFAIPNLNNNMVNKNNMNLNMSNNNNNFQNNLNNENFGNNNNNSFNFYNNNSQNSFMNRNVRNKNTNNLMNINNMNTTQMNTTQMNTTQMNNMGMVNQNNFMVNNNYKNNKNMNDMLGDDNITPKSVNSNINNSGNNSPIFRQNNNNNNANIYQGNNDSALDEYNDNTEGLSLWEIYKDKNNNTFYYNNLTKHSQWNKPIHPNKLFQHNNNEKTKQNGPSGSNLFIFHIPSEWTDLDLFQHFCCFGNIISSKIQRDSTGRNSGFGFVSYDNVMSAHHAIQFMNGYFVNNKYLKVQLKKGEDTKEVQD